MYKMHQTETYLRSNTIELGNNSNMPLNNDNNDIRNNNNNDNDLFETSLTENHWLNYDENLITSPNHTAQSIEDLQDVSLFSFFFSYPYITSLIYTNEVSEARDICANERNFLSWVRLSIFLCIASAALFLQFRFPDSNEVNVLPSPLEKRFTTVFAYIIIALSISVLINSFLSYIETLKKLAQNTLLIYSGARTFILIFLIFSSVILTSIFLIRLEEPHKPFI